MQVHLHLRQEVPLISTHDHHFLMVPHSAHQNSTPVYSLDALLTLDDNMRKQTMVQMPSTFTALPYHCIDAIDSSSMV